MDRKNLFITKNYSGNGVVKEVDVNERLVKGYFSAFDNVDSDGDIIRKGAFSKSIQERGPESGSPRVMHLYQHGIKEPLGRPRVLKEDDFGLYFETQITKTRLGDDVLTMYKDGTLNEHSIGFNIIKAQPFETEDGKSVTEITEVKLWEGSTVTFGANENTPLISAGKDMKSVNEIIEQIEKFNKKLQSGKLSDEGMVLLDIQIQKLKTSLIQSDEPIGEDHSEDDEPKKDDNSYEELKSIFDEQLTYLKLKNDKTLWTN